MKLGLRVLGAAALLMMTTTMSQAAWSGDDIAKDFAAQGFTRIEIQVSATQAKVEAIKGGTKVEVIYDLATGAVLKRETQAVASDDNLSPGVFVRHDTADNFGSDDGANHDLFDDHGGDRVDGDDDDSGDHSGSGSGSDDDDDAGDDHGGHHDDDSHDDDHGSDDD